MSLETKRMSFQIDLSACDSELCKDYRERSKSIHRLKQHIYFERGAVEKMTKENRAVNDMETLKKLQEKFRQMKDKYCQFYNTLNEKFDE